MQERGGFVGYDDGLAVRVVSRYYTPHFAGHRSAPQFVARIFFASAMAFHLAIAAAT